MQQIRNSKFKIQIYPKKLIYLNKNGIKVKRQVMLDFHHPRVNRIRYRYKIHSRFSCHRQILKDI